MAETATAKNMTLLSQ